MTIYSLRGSRVDSCSKPLLSNYQLPLSLKTKEHKKWIAGIGIS